MSVLDRLRAVAAIVVGDMMLDHYVYGSSTRISPEAPVPVVRLEHELNRPGGAANVAASLAALGTKTTACGILGCDREAESLIRCFAEFGNIEMVVVQDQRTATICKTRIIAGNYQQIIRLDRDGDPAAFRAASGNLCDQVFPLVGHHDVLVIADYDKETVSTATVRRIIEECRAQGVPCLIDPKKRSFDAYSGATVLTPNLAELERAWGAAISGESELLQAAGELRLRYGNEYLLVTRGADGMTLVGDGASLHLPANIREVADVSGAGDTVVATIAAALGGGWTIEDACRLATAAAGIAVSRAGTYVVRYQELEAAWHGRSPKIIDWDTAKHRVQSAQASRRRVAFTNGCFDILHAGHLSSLERARRCGDMLIVGLNSDVSVRLNKGPSRPVISENHRAQLLAGLSCVDAIVLFDAETPEELVRHIAPDVLVKGADYADKPIAGADFVRDRGGSVVLLPLLDGLSTTSILRTNQVAIK